MTSPLNRPEAIHTAELHVLFALSNLWMVPKHLLQEMPGQVRQK
jgi:hypothetical protein